MATYDSRRVDTRSQDVRIAGLRTASLKLVIGWFFIGMAILWGIFTFQSYRDGTHLWRYFIYAMAAIGLVLVWAGSRQRRLNS